MEYIDGETLSNVWFDLPEDEKENMIHQVVEIMRSMRTKTSFGAIGGIGPDGSACPLVDGMDASAGRVGSLRFCDPMMLSFVQGVVNSLGLYNIGPLVLRRTLLPCVAHSM